MQRDQKILDFMNMLSDVELANFYFYKYNTFMDYSRKVIDNFFKKKGIDNEKIKELIQSNQNMRYYDLAHRCPRCFSIKKIKTTEQYCPIGYGSGIAAQLSNKIETINVEECIICGYKFPPHKKH
jgi:hypothetical protein